MNTYKVKLRKKKYQHHYQIYNYNALSGFSLELFTWLPNMLSCDGYIDITDKLIYKSILKGDILMQRSCHVINHCII